MKPCIASNQRFFVAKKGGRHATADCRQVRIRGSVIAADRAASPPNGRFTAPNAARGLGASADVLIKIELRDLRPVSTHSHHPLGQCPRVLRVKIG